jgi:Cof subfamily protein (haloacid dehalogenase superfamily)
MYRLVATDLDGTLIGEDLQISAATRNAVERLTKRNCLVVLATGRMFQSAVPFSRELQITAPIISYQGALIRCPQSLDYIWHHTIEQSVVDKIICSLRAPNTAIHLYVDDNLYVFGLSAQLEYYLKLARVTPVYLSDWQSLLYLKNPTKIVATGPLDFLQTINGSVLANFSAEVIVTLSQHGFLEIVPRQAGKGNALKLLASRFGIARSQIVAVGDGLNDLDMIEYAGLGVAMDNAHPLVKRSAGRVTAAVSNDGFASLINDLIDENLV